MIQKAVPDEFHPEKLHPNCDDHCLIGDTLVSTPDGDKRIIDMVGTEGLVNTPTGAKPYTNCHQTHHNAPVFTVETDDGRTVTATATHRFVMADGSLKRLMDLQEGDELMTP